MQGVRFGSDLETEGGAVKEIQKVCLCVCVCVRRKESSGEKKREECRVAELITALASAGASPRRRPFMSKQGRL